MNEQKTFSLGIVVVTILVVAYLFGYLPGMPQSEAGVFKSVEVGIAETSPRGELGGLAIPASGSADDYVVCDMSVSPNPMDEGQQATVSWDDLEGGGLFSNDSLNITRSKQDGTGKTNFGSQESPFVDTSSDDLEAGTYFYYGFKTTTSGSGPCGRGCTPETTTTIHHCFAPLLVEEDDAVVPTADLEIREVDIGSFGESVTVDEGDEVELQWSSTNADRCVGDSYYSTGSGSPTDGTQQTVSEPAGGSNRTYQVTCYNDDEGTNDVDTASVTVTADTGTTTPEVEVDPKQVPSGDTTTVTWDTGGGENCEITGTNGDYIEVVTETGSVDSDPIYGETTYTLECDGGSATDQATVDILPIFEEI